MRYTTFTASQSAKECVAVPKDRIIQIITAWRYPCEGKIRRNGVMSVLSKKTLVSLRPLCPCGKGCKPEKIKIIVMKKEEQ